MTLKQTKALIAANKQHLQLLNQQVQALEDLLAARQGPGYWEDGVYPYFYTAVDQNDEPGILCDPQQSAVLDNVGFEGRIKIQSDAPFVVTHILTCQRQDIGKISTSPFPNPYNVPTAFLGFQGIMGGGPGTGPTSPGRAPNVQLGFIEEGSGRQLFQSEEYNPALATNSNNKEELLSPNFFDSTNMFCLSADGLAFTGHGPNFPFELVSEMELPPNDVVRVMARPEFPGLGENATPSDPVPWRVYVTFLGYKILGD